MRQLVLMILVLLFPCAAHATITDKVVPRTSVTMVSAEFGLLNQADSPQPVFQKTSRVPLREGQHYGWIIQLQTEKSTIKWREEFALPSAPQIWDNKDKNLLFKISSDRKVSITEREVVAERGFISNFWEVAPGDPNGRYVIRVYVEGALVSKFEFDME